MRLLLLLLLLLLEIPLSMGDLRQRCNILVGWAICSHLIS